MGCRPSRHALGKVGDSTWEYNRAFMQDVDKKKQKNKKSGRGRGRKNPVYNDFSSTSKTYYNNRECKSSKITVRLSTDGSTLEIETFDVDFNASSSTSHDISGVDVEDDYYDEPCNVTTVNVHSVEGDRKSRLQRCESAPELVGKLTSHTEPVVWKTWTKVQNTEPPDEKFSCVDDSGKLLSDGEIVYETASGGGYSQLVRVDLEHNRTATRQDNGAASNNDEIATPEVEQICDIFLKKTITSQTVGGYRSISERSDGLISESISKETRNGSSCACLISRDGSNTDEFILPNSCPCPDPSAQNDSQQSLTCTMCLMCKSRTKGRGRDPNPSRPSSCDTLTCLVLFGTPTGAPINPCCSLCRDSAYKTAHADSRYCDQDRYISPRTSDAGGCCCCMTTTQCQASAPSVGGLPYHCDHINSQDAGQIPRCGISEGVCITGAIDRQNSTQKYQPHQDVKAVSSNHCSQINNLKSCSNCSRNGFHLSATTRLNAAVEPVVSLPSTQTRPTSIDLSNCCTSYPNDSNDFTESMSMATKYKVIQGTADGRTDQSRCPVGDATGVCGDDSEDFCPPQHNWTTDDLDDLYYDDCDEYFIDDGVLNTYNFDFLDTSDADAEYQDSEKDVDPEAVELQDPFDNIPTVTRAYEGYSAIFDDDEDNSVDDDDDSDEVYIDAVESSYV